MTIAPRNITSDDLLDYLDLERAIYQEVGDPRLTTAYALSAFYPSQQQQILKKLATSPSTGAFAESSMEQEPSQASPEPGSESPA